MGTEINNDIYKGRSIQLLKTLHFLLFLCMFSACVPPSKDSSTTNPSPTVEILVGTKTVSQEPQGKFIYLPIGRLIEVGNEIEIRINGTEANIKIVQDEHGGAWYRIPVDVLQGESIVSLILIKKESQNEYRHPETDLSLWLKPSAYIDVKNPNIAAKAEELTRELSTTEEKVRAILNYELTKIKFKLIPGWAKDFKTASQTLADGYGICMNYSRVFVALSRASGIPARIITGSVIAENGMDGHHDWAEYYDETAETWFPVDPLSGNGKNYHNLRFIDLIYNTDENSMFPFVFWENERAIIRDGISVLFPIRSVHWDTGRLGYRVIESHFPKYLIAQIDYPLSADLGI